MLEVGQGVLRGTRLYYSIPAALNLSRSTFPTLSLHTHITTLPTSLHLLLQNVVKMLVEAGADVDALDIFGTNALVGAVKAGHSECGSYCLACVIECKVAGEVTAGYSECRRGALFMISLGNGVHGCGRSTSRTQRVQGVVAATRRPLTFTRRKC